MYLDGVGDFKPKPGVGGNNVYAGSTSASPYSKIIKKAHYLFMVGGYNYLTPSYVLNARFGSPYLELSASRGLTSDEYKKISVINFFKQADEKMDDSVSNSGSVIATCKGTNASAGKATYDQAIDANKNCNEGYCTRLYYYMGF